MASYKRSSKSNAKFVKSAAVAVALLSAGVTGCASTTEVMNNGYVVDE